MEVKILKGKDKISIFAYILSVYILGVIAYLYNITLFVAALLLILFIISLFIFKNKQKLIISLYIIFLLSILNCKFQIKDYDTLFLHAPNSNVTLSGIISSIPETQNENKTRFYFDVLEFKLQDQENDIKLIKTNKTFVNLNENIEIYKKLKIGDKLILKGNLSVPFESINPSQFSYRDYLKTKNVYTIFYTKAGSYEKIKTLTNYKWKFLQFINDIRDNIIYKHSKYIGKHKIELLGGVVFGDDAVNPTQKLEDSFLHSGLTHLLAASGLNVGLIFAVCFYIFQIFKMPYKLNIILNMFIIFLYMCMTGFPVSIVRAGIMIEFVLLGKFINREAKSINLISLAAFLMLLRKPLLIKDISFQLSFLVTFGLIISTNTFLKYFPFNEKIPIVIKGDIIAPIISQLWVLPLQMFYFNSFTLYSILANILVLPFIMIVTFIGFLSAFLALIPYFGDILLKLTDTLLNPLLTLIINISNIFLYLPHSLTTTFKPHIFQIILYYLIIISLVLNLKTKIKQIVICVLMLILSFTFIDIKPKTLDIITFAVQNSDMILIKTPNKKYILIDTSKQGYKDSPSKAKMVLIKYLKDNYIKNLELIILTHYDNDHAGGLIDIYKNVNVKKTILLNTFHKSQLFYNIQKYIKENNINFEYAKNNHKIDIDSNVSLTTFYNKDAKDENDSSIITLLEYKNFKALFMGDTSINTYNVLRGFFPKNINFLKLGHHGAKDTLNEQMLNNLTPKIVILSTGQNKYYHPHYSTLSLLNKHKIHFLRTDYDNAIKIETNGFYSKTYRYNSECKKFKLYTITNN